MIIKALLTKKLAAIALMAGLAAVDGKVTNQANRRGAREVNPAIRPFAGTGAVYLATQVDVAVDSILLLKKPHSRMARAGVVLNLAGHAIGIAMSANARREPIRCWRYGPHGAVEDCN